MVTFSENRQKSANFMYRDWLIVRTSLVETFSKHDGVLLRKLALLAVLQYDVSI